MLDLTKDSFRLSEKRIVLYGAASIGLLSKECFEQAGYQIDGFVDKRNDELDSFLGKPVWGIKDTFLDGFKKNDYVIFVSVKNVFDHTNIANNLLENGYHNIIYRPLAAINGVGNERQNALYRVYDYIESKEFEKIGLIPQTIEFDRVEARNSGLMQDGEETVVCLVSMDMLFTDRKVEESPWFNKPVLAELPHIDFFRYVAGEPGYTYKRYMKFCEDSARNTNQIKITEGWRKNVIKNRSSVYSHMTEAMELNGDFFINNAANAIWNHDEGVFNLNSGKHRAAFFASKRRKYIPLRMTKKMYRDYINESAVKKLEDFFRKKGVTEISYPIPHPFYYEYPCENREFYYGFLYCVIYEMATKLYDKNGKINFQELNVLSLLHDGGFVERFLIKSGCRVLTEIYSNEICVMKCLDRLLFSRVLDSLNKDFTNEKFEYAFFDVSEKENLCEIRRIIETIKPDICYLILREKCSLRQNVSTMYSSNVVFSSVLNGQRTDVVELNIM